MAQEKLQLISERNLFRDTKGNMTGISEGQET